MTGTSSLFARDEKFFGTIDFTIMNSKSNVICIFRKITDSKREYEESESGYKILACFLVERNQSINQSIY